MPRSLFFKRNHGLAVFTLKRSIRARRRVRRGCCHKRHAGYGRRQCCFAEFVFAEHAFAEQRFHFLVSSELDFLCPKASVVPFEGQIAGNRGGLTDEKVAVGARAQSRCRKKGQLGSGTGVCAFTSTLWYVTIFHWPLYLTRTCSRRVRRRPLASVTRPGPSF